MERRILVVGDPPICGGRVLPYEASFTSTINDHHVALIGGRAYCEGCHSVGIIAKAGGPRRIGFISEVALEGDVVVCHCPKPQPLMSVLQTTSIHDDMWCGGPGVRPPQDLMALPVIENDVEHAALKRLVDEEVAHPPEAEQIENICPNMTNKEFATLAMRLRDMAIDCMSKQRLPELQRWDKEAQNRAKIWFGVADQPLGEYLQNVLVACVRVLQGLEPKNFVRYIEGERLLPASYPARSELSRQCANRIPPHAPLR